MINMTKHGDDRRSRFEIGFLFFSQYLFPGRFINFFFLFYFYCDWHNIVAHFGCNDGSGVEIDLLVDIGHDAVVHEFLNDINWAGIHFTGQLAHSYEVWNLYSCFSF